MQPAGAAVRRYLRRFTISMAAYAMALAGVLTWLPHAPELSTPVRALVAILPALPILAVIWALARLLIEETDEVNRARVIQQLLWGSATALSVSTLWGFLETLAGAPHLPAYWVFPVFCVGMVLALPYVWWKYS